MSRKLILASTMTMVLAGTDASALGLGGLNTQSVLNQPFFGEIGLEDARPDELDAIKASVASSEAFEKAGIERYYYLTKLTFTPEVTPDGRVVLKVSSREPIREPYMDFLVEVVWSSGKLLKEYTVLLDPPVVSNRGVPVVTDVRANSARAARADARSSSSSSSYIPAPGSGFPVYVGPIRPGSGLWRLANESRPSGATVAQTAMALYRNNQDAFIRGDINRLRVGMTMVIPTSEELFALDATEAEREFAAALRGRSVRRSPITDIPPGALESRLRIAGAPARSAGSPQPAEAVVPSSAGTSLPPAAESAAPSPAVEQDVLRALETSESTRQEALELRDRINELETQLSGVQEILQLRNAELARIQGQMAAPGVLGDQPSILPETPEPPAEPQEALASDESEGSETVVEDQPTVAGETNQPREGDVPPEIDQLPAQEPQDAVAPEEADGLETVAEDPQSAETETGQPLEGDVLPETDELTPPDVAELPLAVDTDVTAEDPPSLMPLPVPEPLPEEEPAAPEEPAVEPPVTEPAAAKTPEPPAPPVDEPAPSTWDSLLLPLAGLAGVTALGILLFSWISMRRKRREEEEEELELDKDLLFEPLDETTEPRTMDASGEDVPTVASSKAADDQVPEMPVPATQTTSNSGGGQAGETGLTRMSSLSNFDAETDEADILSEADIYIAYGRHDEAQDLLRAELKRTPERVDIKYKLAETYASAKDIDSLTGMLDEIEASGGDRADPGLWRRLQEQKEQLLAAGGDTEGESRHASHGGAAQASSGQDSVGLGLEDSFSLDISDLQNASTDVDSTPKADQDDGERSLDLKDEAPLKISDELLDDVLVESKAERKDGLEPDSERDSFGAAPTVSVADQGGFTSEKEQHDSVQIESELVLSLDDRRVEVVDDLDSIFDSGAPDGDEPTLARNEAEGAGPTGPKAKDQGQTSAATDSLEQESSPTDLLSSQWQMDSGIWDETATKLDLARAYIEMDDAEAAREILEEVIAEGREEQRGEAQEMLSKLG